MLSFIYTVYSQLEVLIWSLGRWSSRNRPVKLILIMEGSHQDPIRHEDSLSGMSCQILTRESYIIDTEMVTVTSAGFNCEYVADCPSNSFTSVHVHTQLNASDLYTENITWIDCSQTNFHSITSTDKWGHWEWKLDYSIYRFLLAQFTLKCAVLANSTD